MCLARVAVSPASCDRQWLALMKILLVSNYGWKVEQQFDEWISFEHFVPRRGYALGHSSQNERSFNDVATRDRGEAFRQFEPIATASKGSTMMGNRVQTRCGPCRQATDEWGIRMTQPLYLLELNEISFDFVRHYTE